jgi:hypothetical protein
MLFLEQKLTSFMRQLNIYGFTRTDSGSYSHDYFLRGRPDLLHNIQRIPVKSASRTPMRSAPRSPRSPRSPPMVMEPYILGFAPSSEDAQCCSPYSLHPSDVGSDPEDDIPILSDVEVEILLNFEQ